MGCTLCEMIARYVEKMLKFYQHYQHRVLFTNHMRFGTLGATAFISLMEIISPFNQMYKISCYREIEKKTEVYLLLISQQLFI